MQLLQKYFGEKISPAQLKQFELMLEMYKEWNAKINVISRKDIENLEERHILHSLSIAYHFNFADGTNVLDVGTGGGFPGLPLAVYYPNVQFHLVDSIGKKIKVVEEVSKALDLKNVTYAHQRAEKVKGKFEYIVSRAVAKTDMLLNWVKNKVKEDDKGESGFYFLKGGDLEDELKGLKFPYQIVDLQKAFNEEFFTTKKIVYIPY
ncbi:16S rRNA (guanine(527)-N(7))-methyltransferase RsmG [Chondrinema litorale]|uniref:16S rRNA (guanine(527)-N(7))-methyltransferase RsmG n=1 Tax=Chondrinema litorale TaxID=2994555 RepID=UPI002543D006|nr:16S rRNA (guanine(527)-N(7))-methyltransferase RsmG [Chondrinema litorale]UZR95139.1 16S rRNA (guanine(527)-N(7))-methyltransferase RsmG [Chondrinema litorale]